MKNLDIEIARRIKANAQAQAPAPSRIEETGARLAELKGQYTALDEANYTARSLPKNNACAASKIKIAKAAAANEQYALEQALSVAKPESLIDVLIAVSVSLWRLDVMKGAAIEDREDFETDRGIVENTLHRAIPVLKRMPASPWPSLALMIILGRRFRRRHDRLEDQGRLRNKDGERHCNQRAAQATLNAIEWFGLKELYNAYLECKEVERMATATVR